MPDVEENVVNRAFKYDAQRSSEFTVSNRVQIKVGVKLCAFEALYTLIPYLTSSCQGGVRRAFLVAFPGFLEALSFDHLRGWSLCLRRPP